MRGLAAAMAVAIGVLVSGCSSGQPGDLTAAAERQLIPKVQHIREVAATGNYNRLVTAVHQFETFVRHEVSAGEISESRGNAILDAADTLLTDAQPPASPTPSTRPSSSSPTPSATPSTTPPATPTASSSSSSPSPGTTISIGSSPP